MGDTEASKQGNRLLHKEMPPESDGLRTVGCPPPCGVCVVKGLNDTDKDLKLVNE